MRNWNCRIYTTWRGRTSGASRLPMRNWNFSQSSSLPPTSRFRFQTTYEELKLPTAAPLKAVRAASRLPMRNWNPRPGTLSAHRRSLPDYLWGIETFRVQERRTLSSGFQTTYEELKRRLVLYVSPDFACFQTTYEELKQYEVETFLKKIEAGFQTTYEELKPVSRIGFDFVLVYRFPSTIRIE